MRNLRRVILRYSEGSACPGIQARSFGVPQDDIARPLVRSGHAFIDVLAVSLVAILAACVCLRWMGIDQIHVNGANDQSGYIAAARSLAETGHITGHKIYPSFLLQHASKSVFYMPGFYVCLAGSYKLFGFGVFQSLLPSLIGFVIAAICTCLIARRFYGRRVGWLAAGLFIFFPANLFYACTAMSEMTVTATAAMALCAFVYLSPRARLFIGPILAVIPFLFRDTNAFIVVPMAVLVWADRSQVSHRWLRAALFLMASVLVLSIVNFSPIVAGRPSFIKAAIFNDSPSAAFSDAYALRNVGTTAADWARALTDQFFINGRLCLASMFSKFGDHPMPSLLIFWMPMLLLAIPIGLAWGVYQRDALAVACALLMLCAFCFIFAFNGMREKKALRLVMFGIPLIAVVAARVSLGLASWLDERLRRSKGSTESRAFRLASVVPLCAACFAFPAVYSAVIDFREWDGFDAAFTSILESLHHDDKTLLVGPPGLCQPYVFKHYPLFYSFVPTNAATFDLLRARYTIGTAILESGSALTPQDLAKAGLKLHHRIIYAGATVTVYQRPLTNVYAERWPLPDETIPPGFLHMPEPPRAPSKKRR